MKRLSQLKDEVDTWNDLDRKAAELEGLLDISIAVEDYSLDQTFQSEFQDIAAELSELEWSLALSSQYDELNAILAVHAGAGGTESQDWAEMLLRMYLRWAENRGLAGRVLDLSPGEEAGIKSAAIEISGRYAYGLLKGEAGGAPSGAHIPFRCVPLQAYLLRPGGDAACGRRRRRG